MSTRTQNPPCSHMKRLLTLRLHDTPVKNPYCFAYDFLGRRVNRVLLIRSEIPQLVMDAKPFDPCYEQLGSTACRLVPEPENGLLHIEVDQRTKNVEVGVYGPHGYFPQRSKFVDLANLQIGVYWLRLFNKRHVVEWKMIKVP